MIRALQQRWRGGAGRPDRSQSLTCAAAGSGVEERRASKLPREPQRASDPYLRDLRRRRRSKDEASPDALGRCRRSRARFSRRRLQSRRHLPPPTSACGPERHDQPTDADGGVLRGGRYDLRNATMLDLIATAYSHQRPGSHRRRAGLARTQSLRHRRKGAARHVECRCPIDAAEPSRRPLQAGRPSRHAPDERLRSDGRERQAQDEGGRRARRWMPGQPAASATATHPDAERVL
jgi:hypothetical protein